MKNVLIVDSDMVALHTLSGLVQSQSGLIRVFRANSRQTALAMLHKHNIHLVITGIRLAEGEGFKLVDQLGMDHPDIRVIVMTHNASPIYRAQIKKSRSAVNFDQMADVGMLAQRLFTELDIEHGGRIRGVSLPSFLQMMELEKIDCRLTVGAKARSGWVVLRRGSPHAAATEALKGNAAVLEMLTWEHVAIDIDYADTDLPRDVSDPLVSLIIESGRKIDELQINDNDQRRHLRFNCLVAVDYDISDWTYQCFLRDISEGGAYIETVQPLRMDQMIMLTISSPSRNHSCSIQCKVVRCEAGGIGVRFTELDASQKKVLQELADGYCQQPR